MSIFKIYDFEYACVQIRDLSRPAVATCVAVKTKACSVKTSVTVKRT